MRVTLQSFGGQTAGMRLPPSMVDGATLSEPLRDQLARLVAAAKAHPHDGAPPATGGDVMTHAITIEDDGETIVLKETDTTMSEAFGDLSDWLLEHAAP